MKKFYADSNKYIEKAWQKNGFEGWIILENEYQDGELVDLRPDLELGQHLYSTKQSALRAIKIAVKKGWEVGNKVAFVKLS